MGAEQSAARDVCRRQDPAGASHPGSGAEPQLPGLAARFKGMQAALGSSSAPVRALGRRLGMEVLDGLCMRPGQGPEEGVAAAEATQEGTPLPPATPGAAADAKGRATGAAGGGDAGQLRMPDAGSFAEAVATELGASEGSSGRDLLLLHLDLDDLMAQAAGGAGRAEANGASAAAAETAGEAGNAPGKAGREATATTAATTVAADDVRWDAGCEALEWLDALLRGLLARPDIRERTLLALSFEFLGLGRVEADLASPLLVVRRLPGVVRRDRAERLSYREALAAGGQGAILADRLLPEVAYKVCCILFLTERIRPKAGAEEELDEGAAGAPQPPQQPGGRRRGSAGMQRRPYLVRRRGAAAGDGPPAQLVSTHPAAVRQGSFAGPVWLVPATLWARGQAATEWPPPTQGPAAVATKYHATLLRPGPGPGMAAAGGSGGGGVGGGAATAGGSAGRASVQGGEAAGAPGAGAGAGALLVLVPERGGRGAKASAGSGPAASARGGPPALVVPLEGASVDLMRDVLGGRSPWSRRFPLQLSHPSRPLLHGESTLYLFAESGSAKEQWHAALRAVLAPASSLAATQQLYDHYCRHMASLQLVPPPPVPPDLAVPARPAGAPPVQQPLTGGAYRPSAGGRGAPAVAAAAPPPPKQKPAPTPTAGAAGAPSKDRQRPPPAAARGAALGEPSAAPAPRPRGRNPFGFILSRFGRGPSRGAATTASGGAPGGSVPPSTAPSVVGLSLSPGATPRQISAADLGSLGAAAGLGDGLQPLSAKAATTSAFAYPRSPRHARSVSVPEILLGDGDDYGGAAERDGAAASGDGGGAGGDRPSRLRTEPPEYSGLSDIFTACSYSGRASRAGVLLVRAQVALAAPQEQQRAKAAAKAAEDARRAEERAARERERAEAQQRRQAEQAQARQAKERDRTLKQTRSAKSLQDLAAATLAAAAADPGARALVDVLHGLNMVLVRIGFELLRRRGFEAWLARLIQNKLDAARRPGFLHRLQLKRFDLGCSAPQLRDVRAVAGPNNLAPGSATSPQLALQVVWVGNASAAISTKIDFDQSASPRAAAGPPTPAPAAASGASG
ncbi:hypothetical protein GPECTOR_41g651 [Gonium pectorale]|uniref:SMP-LTD domain-containing protein n=1 Tax=Gonium pectorale TaxID=33097 RepID=A0A150GA12_GONPE|nr:hypothetical protein GPECTOR_41g651 [Gonium pectorale]|eukprot:KXZ46687.1 hypothetical protein GPECTOR_41g651 [Gonium pectorale]